MSDVTVIEKILAHFFYWLDFLRLMINVRRVFQNSTSLLLQALSHRYPIHTILKNGRKVELTTFSALHLISNIINQQDMSYSDDVVTLKLPQFHDKIEIHGGVNNGDIVYTFLKKDYEKLPVENKFVIDVGANIGDTSLFFALSGAKKVIGIEPFPKNFEYAKKNVEANNFSSKIELLLAGCAGKSGFITIDSQYNSNILSKLETSQSGIKIPLVTLEEIIKRFEIPRQSILKIDCEGCEYELIGSCTKETLQQFSHIQIEYHHGYKKIKEKLEKCGFEVTATKPHATDVIHSLLDHLRSAATDTQKHKIGYTGFIFATQDRV